MAMGFESTFQSRVLSYLNSLPGCKAENVSGNAMQSGRPDITGCFWGRMFKLELKTPDNRYKASKKQNLELRRWKNVGCVIGVIYSMDILYQLFSWDWDKRPGRIEKAEANNCLSWYEIPVW